MYEFQLKINSSQFKINKIAKKVYNTQATRIVTACAAIVVALADDFIIDEGRIVATVQGGATVHYNGK